MGFNPDSWYRGSVLTPTPHHRLPLSLWLLCLERHSAAHKRAVGLEQRFFFNHKGAFNGAIRE